MSWIAVAAIGSAAVGAIGSGMAASKASGSSKDASRAAAASDKAQLDWEKEQYAEWQETYGGIEDNLADYYKELTPTLRTMQGLEAFEKEKNVAMTDLRENLAQRGIATSGISAQLETSVALESAAERARIRAAAPMETAREQLSFLQVGLGQDPSAGISGALSTRSTNANRIASDTARASGQATGAFVEAGTNLASELFNAFIPSGSTTKTSSTSSKITASGP